MRLPICCSAAFIACASAACDREFLTTFTSLYLSAQTQGNSSLLTTQLLKNFVYTEQFLPANISAPSSIINKPLNISASRSILDPTLCTAFTEIIVTDPAHPYVIGVRVEGNATFVSKMETLVSDQGDWLFNATGTAYWNAQEKWDVIPESERDTQETIQAAGDAYFDRFGNVNVTVPFGVFGLSSWLYIMLMICKGTPCARLEGGAYTDTQRTNTSTCHLGLPSSIKVVNRRYVVDGTFPSPMSCV